MRARTADHHRDERPFRAITGERIENTTEDDNDRLLLEPFKL